jgi:hypothetical protein
MTMFFNATVKIILASPLTNASDTLSDSSPSATATHTVQFTTGTEIPASGYIEVALPSAFGDVATSSITCPTNTTASVPSPKTARCTASSALASSTAYTITIADVTNPSSSGSQTINITTYNSSDTELENAQVMVAIVDSVTVSATVNASLTFTVSAVNSGTTVNGVDTTGTSTSTTIPFGDLTVNASSTIAQELHVTTNASAGYTVTVQQNHNLLSDNGADIDSFNNGTPATSSAIAWQDPSGTLGDEATYGHFGLTTDDTSLSGGSGFGSVNYKGFDGTNAIEVMYHNGPADGSTQNIGLAKVAYTVMITGLQEAGDYTNTLTYICTPTY